MPLIVMCGIPASGKTRRAEDIRRHLEAQGRRVHVVNEESLSLTRAAAYASSTTEKMARGNLKATVERLNAPDVVVIADSLNYIKGFRYELFCITKAQRTRSCVVHCEATEDLSLRWNRERPPLPTGEPADAYSDECIRELVARFESPDGRSRWDAPLFTVQPDDETPCEAIVAAVVGQVDATVKPHQATIAPPLSSTDFVYELDRITQAILNDVLAAQPPCEVNITDVKAKVTLARTVTLAELRRLRRQFVQITRANNILHGTAVDNAARIAALFVDYLNTNLS